jgi:hypothetical protein
LLVTHLQLCRKATEASLLELDLVALAQQQKLFALGIESAQLGQQLDPVLVQALQTMLLRCALLQPVHSTVQVPDSGQQLWLQCASAWAAREAHPAGFRPCHHLWPRAARAGGLRAPRGALAAAVCRGAAAGDWQGPQAGKAAAAGQRHGATMQCVRGDCRSPPSTHASKQCTRAITLLTPCVVAGLQGAQQAVCRQVSSEVWSMVVSALSHREVLEEAWSNHPTIVAMLAAFETCQRKLEAYICYVRDARNQHPLLSTHAHVVSTSINMASLHGILFSSSGNAVLNVFCFTTKLPLWDAGLARVGRLQLQRYLQR